MIRTKSPEEAGLALALIQIDGGTQSRANVNDQVVNEYAEAIQAGATFPPIVVFYDGKKHWLADGFHRFHAYRKLGREKVAADIRQGTRRDAILHSVGANETHGLRRTRDDKRRAVETLLNDAEWSKWSDGEIAKRCAVSREYVNRIHPKDTCDQVTGMERTFVHPKTGKPTTMKTAGINASRATQTVAREFRAPEGTTPEPSVSKASSAKTVDLGTTSPSVPSVVLQMAWDRATHQERAVFLARNNLRQESDAATAMGGTDVDRSAERASSAVEVGATNSPDGANELLGGLPVPATEVNVERTGRSSAYTRTGRHGAPHVSGATGGESAADDGRDVEAVGGAAPVITNSQSAASTAEAAAETPMAPRPSAAANPSIALSRVEQVLLIRPHCQHPGTDECGGSGRNHCHTCKKLMAESEAA